MKKTNNNNVRHQNEYFLVTDGKKIYRMAPNLSVPKGCHIVMEYYGDKVYTSKGWLKPKYRSLQRIQPRNNKTLLSRSVDAAIKFGNV